MPWKRTAVGTIGNVVLRSRARSSSAVAESSTGRSDGEIAERLFISRKTASVHAAAIKGKLGARSRVEIATDAIVLGLVEAPRPLES